jgi:hypothetical protein
MSLMQLLTAGKSLVGIKECPGRYRMSDPRAMPKFGNGNNPFSTAAGNRPEANPGLSLEKVDPEVSISTATLANAETASVAVTAEVKSVTLRPQGDEKPRVTAARAGQKRLAALAKLARNSAATWAGEWKAKFGAVAPRRKNKAARAKTAPVQGELCLDAVRVMRNDLSDADLEIVRVSPPAADGETSTSRKRSSNMVSELAEVGQH